MGRNPADWQSSGVRQGWGGLGILGRWAGPGRQWPRWHHLSVHRYLNIPSLYFCCFFDSKPEVFLCPKTTIACDKKKPFQLSVLARSLFLSPLFPLAPPCLCLTLIFRLLKKILLTFVRTPWTCQHTKKEFAQGKMFQFFPMALSSLCPEPSAVMILRGGHRAPGWKSGVCSGPGPVD